MCDHQWVYGVWPESWRHYNITALELYPIVAAVGTWGVSWKNRSLCFYTDNESLVYVINRQTSREKTVMTLLRKFVLRCLFFNILFTAKHVAGRDNTLAGKLSRFQKSEFRQWHLGLRIIRRSSPITSRQQAWGNCSHSSSSLTGPFHPADV